MKVVTIAQYKILAFIQQNFNMNMIEVEDIERNAIKVTDINKDSIIFKWEDNHIVF